MRLVITGATGFIGQQIVPLLKAKGTELLLVGRDGDRLSQQFPDHATCTYEELTEAAKGYDCLLHLAVLNNDQAGTLEDFQKANVDLLKSVITAAESCGIKRLFFTSTTKVMNQNGQDPYTISKLEAEAFLSETNALPVSILRLPAVYGTTFRGRLSKLNHVPALLRAPLLNGIRCLRPTLHVVDFADMVLELAHSETTYPVRYAGDFQFSNPLYAIWKWVIDKGFALCVILLFWWLLVVIWMAIKLDSQGPGVFAQRRVGKNGKEFTCYKFRTMNTGTKQAATHTVSKDAITRVGRVLRVSSLDELPQAINILRGEMSLVGPRPCLASQTELVNQRMDRGVYKILPGITGLGQSQNIDMSIPQRLAEIDERYARQRTIPMEIKTLITTAIPPLRKQW